MQGVTVNGLQALYCFRLEVGLEVWDRPANQPASCLGDLGQPCLDPTRAIVARHALKWNSLAEFNRGLVMNKPRCLNIELQTLRMS